MRSPGLLKQIRAGDSIPWLAGIRTSGRRDDATSPSTTNRLVPHARRVPRPATAHGWAVVVVLGLALGFYVWTAATSYPIQFTRHDAQSFGDAYNLMTSGFLHARLSLPLRVPEALLRLHNPFDPATDPYTQGAYHDLLFYRGRLYSSWGPSPTLLYLIVRISGWRLSNVIAASLYCFGGLASAVALLHLLARRLIPGMPDWALLIATIGLALTNVAPFLLRRPLVYEVAISGAYFFEMSGLYLLATVWLREQTSLRRLALASLLLGLGVLARPTMAVGLFALVGVAAVLVRHGTSRTPVLVAALAPLLACLVLLAAYNIARFGSAGDFGTQYQLSAIDQSHVPTERLAYIPPGLFSYLLIPAQLALRFPFVFLQTTGEYPFRLPAHYLGTPGTLGPEVAGGLFPTIPITILLLGLPWVWFRRRPGERVALALIVAAVAFALLVMVLLSFALWGTTQRYEMDYVTEALLAAFLLWGLLLARHPPRSITRRLIAFVGVALTLLGAAGGVAVSFTGYMNLLEVRHPGTFSGLESLTTPFVTGLTEITGRPALTEISGLAPLYPRPGLIYTQFTEEGYSTSIGGTPTTVSIVSPRNEKAALSATAEPSSVPIAGQKIVVREDGRSTVVPIVTPSVRLPIVLRRGMNDIDLTTAHARTKQYTQVTLAGIEITG